MPDIKSYLIALAVGLLVGVIYGLLNVRSPAPPVVALIGLLGILLGEQIVPITKHFIPAQRSGVVSIREAHGGDILETTPCSQRDDQ